MYIEALVEDRSGGLILTSVLKKATAAHAPAWAYRVYPHRGIGHLPDDWQRRPDVRDAALLTLLPAKLRAYRRLFLAGEPLLLIVVMDSDNRPATEMFNEIYALCRQVGREVPTILGLATEELEAWLLGDREAVLAAYPSARLDVLEEYEQDSICGTWEVLCRAIMGDRAESLIQVGYPAVGKFKYEWASAIAPHLSLTANASPSFQRFYRALQKGIAGYRQPYVSSHRL